MVKVISFFIFTVIFMFFLLLVVWNTAVSEQSLSEAIKRSLNRAYSVKLHGFRKGFLGEIKIAEVQIYINEKVAVVISETHGSVNLGGIFRGKILITFDGNISAGTIRLTYEVPFLKTHAEKTLKVYVNSVELSGLDYLKKSGIKGSGLFSGSFTLKTGNRSEGTFEVKKCRFSDFHGGGFYLPAGYITEITARVSTDGQAVNIESVYLTGEGINCRISGRILNDFLDVSIEVMPDGDFKDKNLLFLLKQYELSPGIYVIKISQKTLSLNLPF
ncbi:MAG: type II secretion system protein GspN [Nitrospirae bacterium YQR-1]